MSLESDGVAGQDELQLQQVTVKNFNRPFQVSSSEA